MAGAVSTERRPFRLGLLPAPLPQRPAAARRRVRRRRWPPLPAMRLRRRSLLLPANAQRAPQPVLALPQMLHLRATNQHEPRRQRVARTPNKYLAEEGAVVVPAERGDAEVLLVVLALARVAGPRASGHCIYAEASRAPPATPAASRATCASGYAGGHADRGASACPPLGDERRLETSPTGRAGGVCSGACGQAARHAGDLASGSRASKRTCGWPPRSERCLPPSRGLPIGSAMVAVPTSRRSRGAAHSLATTCAWLMAMVS